MNISTACQDLFRDNMDPYWTLVSAGNTSLYETLCESSMGQCLLWNRSYFPSLHSFDVSLSEAVTLPPMNSLASVMHVLNMVHSESSTLQSIGALVPVWAIYYIVTSILTFLWLRFVPSRPKVKHHFQHDGLRERFDLFADEDTSMATSFKSKTVEPKAEFRLLHHAMGVILFSTVSFLFQLVLQSDCLFHGSLASLQHFIFIVLHYATPVLLLTEVGKMISSTSTPSKVLSLGKLVQMIVLMMPSYVLIDYYRNQKHRAGVTRESCRLTYGRLLSRMPFVMPVLHFYNLCGQYCANACDQMKRWQQSSRIGLVVSWIVWVFYNILKIAFWSGFLPIRLFFNVLDGLLQLGPVKWVYSVAVNWGSLAIPGLLTGKWMHDHLAIEHGSEFDRLH